MIAAPQADSGKAVRRWAGALLGGAAAGWLGWGWACGSWLLGAAGGAVSLCLWALAASPNAEAPGSPGLLGRRPPVRRRPLPAQGARRARPEQPGDELVVRLLDDGRYALLLRPELAPDLDAAQLREAWATLRQWMALIPGGAVLVRQRSFGWADDAEATAHEQRSHVAPFYLDRYLVTNGQYAKFVADGGYEDPAYWDPDALSLREHFTDATGRPGPRHWRGGRFPDGQADWPVVGVSWHEAQAYARWAGKRLPTDAEWVKAASWPLAEGGRLRQRKYPWGQTMDYQRANVWGAGLGEPAPVNAFADGANPAGVHQLCGNVWEWTATDFPAPAVARRVETAHPMKSVRGGAYDTYFDHQAAADFQSGDELLARKPNLGFRCAVSAGELTAAPAEEGEA